MVLSEKTHLNNKAQASHLTVKRIVGQAPLLKAERENKSGNPKCPLFFYLELWNLTASDTHWSHRRKVLSLFRIAPQSAQVDLSCLTTTSPFSNVIISGEPSSIFISSRYDFGMTIRPFLPSVDFFIVQRPKCWSFLSSAGTYTLRVIRCYRMRFRFQTEVRYRLR